ncbi:MAG: hypothetical protein ACOC44_00900 [Promethearchaeia archaeon]
MNSSDEIERTKKKKIIKKEINLQFHWYFLGFFVTYLGSFLIPGILFILYILLVFLPYFLEVEGFLLLFTNLKSLMAFLLFPLVLIGLYLLHLFCIGLITKFFWWITERKSPSRDGIIPRNIPSKTLNFYMIRSFIIKYPKYVFTKGIFPWLINWLYNIVGSTQVGKGTTIEEGICGERFVEIGENCYIGVNTVLTSHLVEGIFGNIAYFKIIIGDNCTMAGFNCIAPGTELKDDSYLLPLASTAKYSSTRGDKYYFGMPLRRASKRNLRKWAGLTKDMFEKVKDKRESPTKKMPTEK